jgi:hypothetical protein
MASRCKDQIVRSYDGSPSYFSSLVLGNHDLAWLHLLATYTDVVSGAIKANRPAYVAQLFNDYFTMKPRDWINALAVLSVEETDVYLLRFIEQGFIGIVNKMMASMKLDPSTFDQEKLMMILEISDKFMRQVDRRLGR